MPRFSTSRVIDTVLYQCTTLEEVQELLQSIDWEYECEKRKSSDVRWFRCEGCTAKYYQRDHGTTTPRINRWGRHLCPNCILVEYGDLICRCHVCQKLGTKGDFAAYGGLCSYCYEPLKVKHLREYERLASQLSRARRAGVPATLTLYEWIGTLAAFDGKCAYCRVADFTCMEHFIPVELGGGTTADNCVPSCQSCNMLKKAKHPLKTVIRGMDLDAVANYLKQVA